MDLPLPQNLAFWERFLALPNPGNRQLEQMRFAFATGWSMWLLIPLLVLAFAWFAWLYRRDGSRPRWHVKALLLLLRMSAFSLLLFLLAQPILRYRLAETIRARVAILLDTSESMNVADRKLPADRLQKEAKATGTTPETVLKSTRIERMNALLNRSGVLTELSKTYNVQAYTFAGEPRPLPLPTEPQKRAAYAFKLAPETQKGDSTQIGEALRRPLEDFAGQPIAGVLAISDGGQNLGEDPLTAAASAKQTAAPVSTLGIGDPTKTKDIALLSLLADDVVRTNNTVSVYAAFSQRGYSGKSGIVTFQRGSTVLGRQTVRFGRDDAKQEARFNFTPTQPGRFDYSVTVTPYPDELTAKNNRRTFAQTVISKKLRVLYVESEPRYEYRYLRNAILRDRSLEFACLLLDNPESKEGSIPIRAFPPDEKSLFEYDIVLLGDIPRSALSNSQLEALRRFVEDRGGSLLVIAGEQNMPHAFAGTPLEAVLPVALRSTPNPILTEEPFQWQRTPEGKRSPILELEDDPAANEATWAQLPGMFWAAGVERAKPGATVLAVHPTRSNANGPLPLLALQNFGSGKCYIQLADSAWQWRWRVGDRHFYRYWGQVFRALTPKEIPGNSRFVQINADRERYRLGEKVSLSARLLNRFYRPIKADSVTAIVKSEGGTTQKLVLQATPNAPGLFTADFLPDKTGKWEISLTSPTLPDAKATTSALVESLALERQKPELDETLLKRIAGAGGGKYYTPDQLMDWAKSLKNNALTVRREEEIEIWSRPIFLFAFVMLLALEWILRKRSGLL